MMTQLLAQAATVPAATPPDPAIPWSLLTAFVLALIPIIGAVWIKAKKAGIREATNNVTIADQPVNVRTQPAEVYAYQDDLEDHIARIDKTFGEVWEAIERERKIARDALGKIHDRIDNQATSLATMTGTVKAINETLGKLLDLALGKKPPGR